MSASVKNKILLLVAAVVCLMGWVFRPSWLRSFLTSPPSQNLLLIAWDATSLQSIERLLQERQLPHLQSLIENGTFIRIKIENSVTVTKVGWSEALTGYDAVHSLGILDNLRYQPIPPGLTVFERLETYFGSNLFTAFLGAKSNNIGQRGPHSLCINCVHREQDGSKTLWWDESKETRAQNGEEKKWENRAGEPFMNLAKNIDFYQNDIGAGKRVQTKLMELLERNYHKPFFIFVLFEEPHELGHSHGEGSPEYKAALVQNDLYLKEIIEKLKALGIDQKTRISVVSSNGYDLGDKTHFFARFTFFTWFERGLRSEAARIDLAPTILDFFGIDPKKVSPELRGKSLYAGRDSSSLPESEEGPPSEIKIGYFHDGLTQMFYRAFIHDYFKDQKLEVDLLNLPRGDKIYRHVFRKRYSDQLEYNGTTSVEKLIHSVVRGEIQMAIVDSVSFIRAVNDGLPLVALAKVASDAQGPGMALVLRKSLGDPNTMLRGLRIGCLGPPKGNSELIFRQLFFVPNTASYLKGAQLSFYSGTEELENAILSKKIDGAFADLGAVAGLLRKGVVTIDRTQNWMSPDLNQALLVSNKKFLMSGIPVIEKVLRAYRNKVSDEALVLPNVGRKLYRKSIGKGFKLSDDQFQNLNDLRVNIDRLSELQKLLFDHKWIERKAESNPPISDFVDNQFVQKASESFLLNPEVER